MLEILAVVAIVGTAASFGLVGTRRIVTTQQERTAVNSIRQLVSQGASAAASRGLTAELFRSGQTLTVRATSGGAELRRAVLPAGVTTTLPSGVVMYFGAPGRVCFTAPPACSSSVPAGLNPFTVTAGGKTRKFTVSLIGEVREVP